ncbi:unnamed protein product [Meloidogyne enterolobii]|uniref:Uncharacterized protein n=1 Tax=Meloidogyne enterolobii TaxID=390850 RepID=A0ACB0YY45_MELEN
MAYFRLGKCTICHTRLSTDNIYSLKNCNHTYHKKCITRWIEGGSETCPRCRAHTTLDDIKQFFIEEAGDSSQESDDEDEFTEGTSNVVIPTPAGKNTVLDLKNKVYERKGHTVGEQRLVRENMVHPKVPPSYIGAPWYGSIQLVEVHRSRPVARIFFRGGGGGAKGGKFFLRQIFGAEGA